MPESVVRKILVSLSEGLSPGSQEPLPADSVIQHPEVFRALLAGIQALDAQERSTIRRSARPGRTGSAWTMEENEQLQREFEAGLPIDAIAAAHERSARAIAVRLQLMGWLSADDLTARSGSGPSASGARRR